MQDIRIRIGVGSLLCTAAFLSLYGAAAAFFWWLLFTPRTRAIGRVRPFIVLLAMIGTLSFFLLVINGTGISYFLRMMVIILFGFWLAGEYRPGELINLGVWLFGNGIGFEIGLIAEMSMQSLSSLVHDFDRIRMAFHLKGTALGVKSIVPAGLLLTYTEIVRAQENAELLAVRGYRYGGSLIPNFAPNRSDLIAGLCAIPVVLLMFFCS